MQGRKVSKESRITVGPGLATRSRAKISASRERLDIFRVTVQAPFSSFFSVRGKPELFRRGMKMHE